jgi:hypothetical protein
VAAIAACTGIGVTLARGSAGPEFYSVNQVRKVFAAHGMPLVHVSREEGRFFLTPTDPTDGTGAIGDLVVEVWPPGSSGIGRDPYLGIKHDVARIRNVAVGFNLGYIPKVPAAVAQLRRTRPAFR